MSENTSMIFEEFTRVEGAGANTHLQLNICNLIPRELKLVQRHLRLFQVTQESNLFGSQQQQCMAGAAFASGRSADTMNVFLWGGEKGGCN